MKPEKDEALPCPETPDEQEDAAIVALFLDRDERALLEVDRRTGETASLCPLEGCDHGAGCVFRPGRLPLLPCLRHVAHRRVSAPH